MATTSAPSRKRIPAMLLAGLALVVVLLAAEAFRRHELYWYDIHQDYAYDFVASSHSALPVDIGAADVVLPAWKVRWDTGLLRLNVSARLSGWWFEPCVVIGTGEGTDRQCFERGASGDRYLLLGPVTARPGRRLELRGEHLKWQAQTGKLLLFDNHDLEHGRVLVLAPHPDDAEIAAFGLYSGRESFIVTITAGNYVDGLYGQLHGDPSVQDALRGEMRSWDSLTVPQMGGVPPDRVVNLGYETNSLSRFYEAAQARGPVSGPRREGTGQYRRGAVQSLLGGRVATSSWTSVVADLAAVLATVQPELVVAPHPALDAAPDHRFTTLALLEALKATKDTRAILLLYDNHHRLSEHYPFGSSGDRITLPPWFGGVEFASVYSHDLDGSAQLRKLFSLEAMHDLRGAPLRLTGGPFRTFGDRLQQGFELIRRDPFGEYSYFRRAVRPNELFFVYRPQDRNALR